MDRDCEPATYKARHRHSSPTPESRLTSKGACAFSCASVDLRACEGDVLESELAHRDELNTLPFDPDRVRSREPQSCGPERESATLEHDLVLTEIGRLVHEGPVPSFLGWPVHRSGHLEVDGRLFLVNNDSIDILPIRTDDFRCSAVEGDG